MLVIKIRVKILKINLKLAQSSLDEISTKDKFLSYNKYLDKYNDFSFNHRKFY
jgi:hypothetical protein